MRGLRVHGGYGVDAAGLAVVAGDALVEVEVCGGAILRVRCGWRGREGGFGEDGDGGVVAVERLELAFSRQGLENWESNERLCAPRGFDREGQ